MAVAYNIESVSNRIRSKIIDLGNTIHKSILYGTDFECYVDEVNCLYDSLTAINGTHITDIEKNGIISNIYKKYSL